MADIFFLLLAGKRFAEINSELLVFEDAFFYYVCGNFNLYLETSN